MGPSACGAGGAKYLAVKTYLEGEILLDRGETSKGIRFVRRAIGMEPELEKEPEEWPLWAQRLHAGLQNALPPPHAVADAALGPTGHALTDDVAERLAGLFRDRNYVVIDDVLPASLGDAAFEELRVADAANLLEPATVHSVETQANVLAPDRRADRIKWLDLASDAKQLAGGDGGLEEGRQWAAAAECVERMDVLIKRLRDELPDELSNVLSRQRPMVSAYSEGARFERHCDNHCDGHPPSPPSLDDAATAATGGGRERLSERSSLTSGSGLSQAPEQRGACANRRRISALLYCTPEWSPDDGGALRLYRAAPAVELDDEEDFAFLDGDDALVDVLPCARRLVLFASDQRVPHEVMPVLAKERVRYAIALWYADAV